LFVVLGHYYPVTMQFNGGKEKATFLGIILFINWKIAIISYIIFLFFTLITNNVIFYTLTVYLSLLMYIYIVNVRVVSYIFLSFIMYNYFVYGMGTTYIAFLLMMFFIVKHKDNVKCIMNKEEVKLSSLLRRQTS